MAQTAMEIIRGDTVPLTITVLANGSALNITGYTFFFTAKRTSGDADGSAVISKTVTTLSDPTHGIMVITLTPTDTAIDAGKYLYDIQMVSGAGAVTTLFYGVLTVLPEITQRVV
jgi:hypothetical protein